MYRSKLPQYFLLFWNKDVLISRKISLIADVQIFHWANLQKLDDLLYFVHFCLANLYIIVCFMLFTVAELFYVAFSTKTNIHLRACTFLRIDRSFCHMDLIFVDWHLQFNIVTLLSQRTSRRHMLLLIQQWRIWIIILEILWYFNLNNEAVPFPFGIEIDTSNMKTNKIFSVGVSSL